jgi:hypothetical protein
MVNREALALGLQMKGCGVRYMDQDDWMALVSKGQWRRFAPYKPEERKPILCGKSCGLECCLKVLCYECAVKVGIIW